MSTHMAPLSGQPCAAPLSATSSGRRTLPTSRKAMGTECTSAGVLMTASSETLEMRTPARTRRLAKVSSASLDGARRLLEPATCHLAV
eukprot:7600864-Pyramimonas_sp.AAC.1